MFDLFIEYSQDILNFISNISFICRIILECLKITHIHARAHRTYKFKFIFQLSVSIKLPSGNDYSLELDLAHPIIVGQCSHKILPSKIEIKLKKRDGIRWNILEGNPVEHVVQPIPNGELQVVCILCYFIIRIWIGIKFRALVTIH